jgi:hypothetical protein
VLGSLSGRVSALVSRPSHHRHHPTPQVHYHHQVHSVFINIRREGISRHHHCLGTLLTVQIFPSTDLATLPFQKRVYWLYRSCLHFHVFQSTLWSSLLSTLLKKFCQRLCQRRQYIPSPMLSEKSSLGPFIPKRPGLAFYSIIILIIVSIHRVFEPRHKS